MTGQPLGGRAIRVARCGLSDAAPVAQAVLYVTDADGYFGGAVDLVRSMQLRLHLPPMLVVGVGYPVDDFGATMPMRTRDFTPTVFPPFAEWNPGLDEMGGAAGFFDFLTGELRSWAESQAPVARDAARCLFGHSLGGMFAAWALLQRPDAFDCWICASPSLWWDSYVVVRQEAEYAAAQHDLPARVFFAIGGDETQEGREREASRQPEHERAFVASRRLDMVADMEQFVATLRGRGYPRLEVESLVLPGEYHVTVPLVALSRGLRWALHAP